MTAPLLIVLDVIPVLAMVFAFRCWVMAHASKASEGIECPR
jgi:hypothetical protein